MRVLAILYCYPPLLVPASIVYAKLMAGLRECGVDVEVLTIQPESFDAPGEMPLDPDLAAVLPQDIVQHAVRSPETSLAVRIAHRLDPEHRFTWRWLEPRKREWTLPALRQWSRERLQGFDLLLSCSQPHANHLLGLELKRRSGLPWIAYFSDPWTGNPYASYPSSQIRDLHARMEREVVQAADLVLYTCEEMLRFVRGRQPLLRERPAGVLPHAFVPDWYPERLRGPSKPVRLLHTGNFYGPRTPDPLIDALLRLRAARGDDEMPLRIVSHGGMENRHRERIRAEGLDSLIELRGFVPYLESLALMREVDGLLLIDAPTEDAAESIFLPSKLIDYLGSQTPVVALTPGRGATARVLDECGGVVCPLERPAELDRFLLELCEGGSFPATPRGEAIRRYEYGEVARSLQEMMDPLASARR